MMEQQMARSASVLYTIAGGGSASRADITEAMKTEFAYQVTKLGESTPMTLFLLHVLAFELIWKPKGELHALESVQFGSFVCRP